MFDYTSTRAASRAKPWWQGSRIAMQVGAGAPASGGGNAAAVAASGANNPGTGSAGGGAGVSTGFGGGSGAIPAGIPGVGGSPGWSLGDWWNSLSRFLPSPFSFTSSPPSKPSWSDIGPSWMSSPPVSKTPYEDFAPPPPSSSPLQQAVDSTLNPQGNDTFGGLDFDFTPPKTPQSNFLSTASGMNEENLPGMLPSSLPPLQFNAPSLPETGGEVPPAEIAPQSLAQRTQQQLLSQVQVPTPMGEETGNVEQTPGTRVYPGEGIRIGNLWRPSMMGEQNRA